MKIVSMQQAMLPLILLSLMAAGGCDSNAPATDVALPEQVEQGEFAFITEANGERHLHTGPAYFDSTVWDQHDNEASLIMLSASGGESAPVLWLSRLGKPPVEGQYNVAKLPPEPSYEYEFTIYDGPISIGGRNILGDRDAYARAGKVTISSSRDGQLRGHFEITMHTEETREAILLSGRFRAQPRPMGFPYF